MPIISPKIPSGLEDLMRGLAKSCIKENPDNIYEFAAEYFENLLKQRDGGLDQGYKNFATYKVYKKNRSARSRRDKENVIDGSSFRGGVANGFGQELIKSGSAKEKYFASEDKSEIEEIFLPSSRPSTAEVVDKSISVDSEINTVILKKPSIEDEGLPTQSINSDEEDIKNMVLDADMEQAALKIQSTFRGFKTRKEMRGDKGDDMEIDGENVVNDEEDVIVKSDETTLSAGLPSVDSLKDDAEQLGSDVENVIEDSENMLKTDMQDGNILDTITSSHEDVDSHVIPLMTEDNENESTTKDIDDDETAEMTENQSEVTDIECTEGNIMILNDEDLTATSQQELTEAEHELVEGAEVIETCLEHKVSENLEHSIEVIEVNSEIIDEMPEENHENSQEVCVENVEHNTDVEKSEEIDLEVTDKLEESSPILNEETQQETLKEEESTTMSLDNKDEENTTEIVNNENVDTEIDNDIPDATELILQSKSSEDKAAFEEITLDEDITETKVEHRAFGTMENISEEKLSVEKETETSLEAIEVPEENVLLGEKLSSEVVEDAAAGSVEKCGEIVEATIGEVENLLEDVNENEAENIVSEDVMNVNNNTMPEGTENADDSSTTVDLIAIENIESLPENVIQSMDKVDSTQITPDASMNEFEKLTESEAAENVIQTEEVVDEVFENVVELVQNSCEDLLEIEGVDKAEIKASSIEEANLELTQDKKSEDQNETLENVESAMISNETMEKECLLEAEGSNGAIDKSQESSGEQQEVVEIIEKKSVEKLETVGVIESVDEVDIKDPLETVKQTSIDEDVFVMNADEILAIVEMSIEQMAPEINELANETDNVAVDNVEAEAVLEESLNAVSETLSAHESAEKETECSIDIPPTEKSIDEIFINSGEDIGTVAPSDDILEPEKEESEIPEESSTTIDENLTTDEVPVITNEENQSSIDVTDEIVPESQQENDAPKATEEEDVSDMILDDEMEEAALKIQAAFRGHQVRKDTAPPTHSNDNEIDNKNEEENQSEEKNDNEIVIDNCSNDQLFSTEENDKVNEETAVEVEENEEEATAEETKEDEAEEEAQTEEETNEEEEKEAEEEENAEEEVEVETVENEGGSDEPDAAGEPADQASGSTEQATNDDDDVANMVMDEDMEQAALKIQSTFRGHKTRKDMKNKEEETSAETADASEEKKDTVEELNEDVANMVMDEEMEQAALKIQSTFRGHKTRKDMKNKDGEDETEEKEEDEAPKEEEKPEEPKPEETKAEESTSSGKTAQQLQDEEDIANIVMDKDMEKAALKIQNTFRGKRFGAKKGTQDEDVSYESSNSSAADNNEEDNNLDGSNESPIKILSEEEQFTNEDTIKLSQEQSNESVDKSVTDENDSNFMAAHQYSASNEERYSIDRFNDMSPQHQQQHQESFEIGNSIEMILMKSSEELIGESATCDVTSGASGEDKDNDDEKENLKMKTFSIESVDANEDETKDDEDEIDEPLAVEKIIQPLTITTEDDEKLIENFDFNKNKNTAEAMYMQLKKNEMETQKQVTVDAIEHVEEDEEDDDDVVVSVAPVVKGRKLKYGMSMDDRLLGLSRSILSQDYSPKMQKIDSGEERGYNPMLEASKQSTNFMNQLHSRSIESDDGKDYMTNYRKLSEDMGEEDQFDDFYPGNIRQKMMASSISIADSDYFDPTKSQVINDDTIRTALETINSTDSESTIASAATKIQAGARGLITRRKLNNNASSSQQYASYASFGNAAIDKSLDDFIVAQEQERLEEESEGDVNTHDLPKHESTDEWTDDDKKSENVGVIGIKLEQKNFLTVDERRRTLHREDAIQRNSTSSNTSSEKLIDNSNSTQMETVVDIQSQQPLETAEEPISIQEVIEPNELSTTKTKSVVSMKTSKIPKSLISRQKTMPVQIDTNIIRILPKHLRKRIRSAESDKKKKSK